MPVEWSTRVDDEDDQHQTAIFRQVNKERLAAHHDAIEFPAVGWGVKDEFNSIWYEAGLDD